MIDLPPPNYEQTVAAIVKCAIPHANIRIAYERELQSDEVTITHLGQLTDAKLHCLKAAVHPFYLLTIADQEQRAAFYDFSRREDRPREKADATEWLRQRGLLDRLPRFEPYERLEQFAERFEIACGIDRGKGLMMLGPSSLTVRPDLVQTSDFEKSGEHLYCLMQMFAASNANEHGVSFGFVGNEAYAEEKK